MAGESVVTRGNQITLTKEIREKMNIRDIAYLIAEGRVIEYQDVAIAATFRVMDADYLLTLISHFMPLSIFQHHSEACFSFH